MMEDSFSSTTIETATSTASYDTVASELAHVRESEEESDIILVVHLQGTDGNVPVTSI